MNIRIGNDIKIRFTLRGPFGFDSVNVKQMRCYLINTAFDNNIDFPEDKPRRPRRFPFEPFPQFHAPSRYAVKGCGYPHYNTLPYNRCDYSAFCPGFIDYHWWPFYSGFGTRPDKFTCCTPPFPDKKPIKEFDPVFLAPSIIEEEDKKASTYFPACEQIMCGPYRLVVVLVVWDQGWGRNNLHTYTLDYGILFNLVDDESGMDGNIIIDGDTGEIEGGAIKRMYFENQDIYLTINEDLEFGEFDNRQNLYRLYCVLENGSTIEYEYDLWSDHKLNFESDNPLVEITYEGKLMVNDSAHNGIAHITVKDPNSDATTKCTVHVNSEGYEYIGFANTTKAYELDFDAVDSQNRRLFQAVDELEGNQHVENFNTGYYFWIISRDPIKDCNCSCFDVPLDEVQMLTEEGYYCYHCPNPLIATKFDVSIVK